MAANYVEDARLKCHGCKSNNLFLNCSVCKIRDCAVARKVEHCSDCPEFPGCKNLKELQKAKNILPHLSANLKNLETIREIGVNQWLGSQEDEWKCPQCQTPFSWYATSCYNCGRDLTEHSYKLSLFKFKIFKMLMPLVKKRNK